MYVHAADFKIHSKAMCIADSACGEYTFLYKQPELGHQLIFLHVQNLGNYWLLMDDCVLQSGRQ